MYGAARMDICPSSWSKAWSYSSLSCNKFWEWGLCHILSVGESARWSEQGAHLPHCRTLSWALPGFAAATETTANPASFSQAGENALLKPGIFAAHDALREAVDDGVFFVATEFSSQRGRRMETILDILAEIIDQLADPGF